MQSWFHKIVQCLLQQQGMQMSRVRIVPYCTSVHSKHAWSCSSGRPSTNPKISWKQLRCIQLHGTWKVLGSWWTLFQCHWVTTLNRQRLKASFIMPRLSPLENLVISRKGQWQQGVQTVTFGEETSSSLQLQTLLHRKFLIEKPWFLVSLVQQCFCKGRSTSKM